MSQILIKGQKVTKSEQYPKCHKFWTRVEGIWINPYTGWQQSFHTILMWICGSLVHVNKNCRKLQILIGIIPTFSENFIQINQVWPQLQPKTWSEAILKMYKSLHHFIIDSLQKCILEACINRLDIKLRMAHFGSRFRL